MALKDKNGKHLVEPPAEPPQETIIEPEETSDESEIIDDQVDESNDTVLPGGDGDRESSTEDKAPSTIPDGASPSPATAFVSAQESPLIGKSWLHGRRRPRPRPDQIGLPGQARLHTGDPLGNILSGSPVPLMGEQEETVPQKVLEVLQDFNLTGKPFQCIIKHIPDGCDESLATYVKSINRKIPTVEWIGKMYGPGEYILSLRWQQADQSGNRRWKTEDIPLTISSKMESEYRRYQMEMKLRELEERRKKIGEAMLDQKLEKQLYNVESGATDESPLEVGKKYLKQVIETNKELGLGGPAQMMVPPAPKGTEWEKILPVLIPAVTGFIGMMQQNAQQASANTEKFMMMMLKMSSDSNQQMLELMKANNGQGTGQTFMKEYTDMIRGVIDLKELVNGGQKETVVDRIFGLVERVAPEIIQVASMRQRERMADPRYYAAKGMVAANPDFQKVLHDPKLLAEFISRLDKTLGWEQTDKILEVGGIVRPDACPRDPAEKLPADERDDSGADVQTQHAASPQKTIYDSASAFDPEDQIDAPMGDLE